MASVADLKSRYLESLVAPMDGMWDSGITDPAPHYELYADEAAVGYCVINDDNVLLQFHMESSSQHHAGQLLDYVLAARQVRKAVVSTIDPFFHSLCVDRMKSATAHTILYEADHELAAAAAKLVEKASVAARDGLTMVPVDSTQLEQTVTLQQRCLGGGAELVPWLSGYSGNLIARGELFALSHASPTDSSEESVWLGLGERRLSESQPGIVDLGMMVDPNHRGRGFATMILAKLCAACLDEGLRPICSTTVENVGAQKAIVRAGFASHHEILDVEFS